jgi:hypothetical protein
MPLPSSHMKEHLHRAYVHAVAARAGSTCSIPGGDYGVDITINEVRELPNGHYQQTGYLFHCQLKATTTCEIRNGQIVYDMEAEAYNKLVTWEGSSFCILVLFFLPESDADWLHMDEEQLLLRKCCYWKHVEGPETKNNRSQRIQIPRNQTFTPEAVEELLAQARRQIFG